MIPITLPGETKVLFYIMREKPETDLWYASVGRIFRIRKHECVGSGNEVSVVSVYVQRRGRYLILRGGRNLHRNVCLLSI